jgi:MFS family permease
VRTSRRERALANLGALSVPAYRRYLAGATANNITVWLFQTALSWTILTETDSATAVGFLFLAWTLPTLFTMVPAGVFVDRLGPRRGMVISQVVSVFAFGSAAALAIAGQLTVERALAIAVIVGAIDGFWSAPSLVMAGRVVRPNLLASALGLSSITFGIGRIVGGLLGGALVAAAGPAPALTVAAVGPAVAAALTLTLPDVPGLESSRRGSLRDFPDALAWLVRLPAARALMLLGLAVATFGYCYISILPIVTRDLLVAGAGSLGLLTAGTGVGIVVGAFTMEALGRRLGRGRTIVLMVVIGSLAFGSIGLSRLLPLSMLLVGTAACVFIIFRTTTIALLQALAPPRMRGRVLSIFEIGFWGIFPVGGILAGILADRYGATTTLFAFAATLLLALAASVIAYRPLPSLDIDAEGRARVRGAAVGGESGAPAPGAAAGAAAVVANATEPVIPPAAISEPSPPGRG